MDGLVKNGESSSSAMVRSSAQAQPHDSDAPIRITSRPGAGTSQSQISVIPHDWNLYPPLPLHPSMDILSLVNLRPQFDRFVRPYLLPHILQPDVHAAPTKEDAEAEQQEIEGKGKKKKKKNQRRLDRGYEGLIEECIDPTPLPASDSLRSLLYGPPALEIQNIQVRPFEGEAWRAACRLDVGRVRGYHGGEKDGVEAAEAKRKNKKLKKSASAQPTTLVTGSSPIPGSPFSPYPQSAGLVNNNPGARDRDGLLRISLKTSGTPGAGPQPQIQTGVKRARSQSRGLSVSRGPSPVPDGRRDGSAGPPNKRGTSQPNPTVHQGT